MKAPPRIFWDGTDFAYVHPGPLLRGQPVFYRAQTTEDLGPEWVELRPAEIIDAGVVSPDGERRPPAAMLREFHAWLGQRFGTGDLADITLRRMLIEDEFRELLDALDALSPAWIAQEMADLIYVLYGSADTWGWDLDALTAAVHHANMRKFRPPGPILNEHGKLQKPEGWVGPEEDIAEILRERKADATS